MTNLSKDASIRIWGEAHIEKFHVDTSGARTIHKGHPMLINQSEDTLYASDWDDGSGEGIVAADDVFLGIAAESKTVAASASETDANSLLDIYVEPTIVGFKSAVFTNANLGATVHMSDSNTLSTTAADNPQIGKLHRVEDGYAYVRLETPKICSDA
jgi:hypothetical protein